MIGLGKTEPTGGNPYRLQLLFRVCRHRGSNEATSTSQRAESLYAQKARHQHEVVLRPYKLMPDDVQFRDHRISEASENAVTHHRLSRWFSLPRNGSTLLMCNVESGGHEC